MTILKYIKYLFTAIMMTPVMVGFLLGGWWMWMGFAVLTILMVGGDGLLGEDKEQPEYRHKWILNGILYLTLPFLLVLLAALAWSTGSGNADFLKIGVFFQGLTGIDVFAAREANNFIHYTGGVLSAGLAVAGYGTNIAHELTHRTTHSLSMIIGRWLLAMTGNADFAIEHVYGHHETVATAKDPATAKRGENVYAFTLRSIVYGHISAWKLETARLKKKNQWLISPKNRMLTGYAMTAVLLAGFIVAGGWLGAVIFATTAFWGKCVLEIVNYMEHYGLVRVEGQPVMPRHSWNTNKTMSSLVLFSLTRHSAHHEAGELPFWDLDPYPEAPEMPYGYLTTIFIALVPPVWYRIMAPKLQEWDEKQATEEERRIAQAHTKKSGQKLVGAAA